MKKAIHFLITVCLLLCMIAPALVENESSEYVTISSADEADFLNCVQHYIDTYNQCGKAPWCWVEKEYNRFVDEQLDNHISIIAPYSN